MPASVTLTAPAPGVLDPLITGGRIAANVLVKNTGPRPFPLGLSSLNFALTDPAGAIVPIHVDLPENTIDVTGINPGESRGFVAAIQAYGVAAGAAPNHRLSCSVGGGIASVATYFR